MQITIEKKEESEVSLKVEIPREKIEEEISRAFRTLVKETKIPGFRKGRVPRKIFEAHFGKETLQEEAMKKLYPQVYKEIENEYKLIPVMKPEVEILSSAVNEPLVLKIDMVTKPPVRIGSYEGIEVKRKKIEVSEKEITETLKQIQKQHANYVPIKETRGAKKGDWLILDLDWEIKSPGKKSLRKKEKNLFFQLGSPSLPSSFSEGLVGIKMEESRHLDIEFPPQYAQKKFAGKNIIFQVLLKEIKEEKLPQLDDEFAKDLKFNDLKSLKENLKEKITKIKENEEEKRLKKEIVKKIVNNTRVSLPSSLIEEKIKERIEDLESELKSKGSSLRKYLEEENLKEAQLREKLRPSVEKNLKTFFILDAIAEKESISVEEKEIEERLKNLANIKNEEELKKLKNNFLQTGRLEVLKNQIKEEKAIELLYNKAEIK